MAPKGWCFPLRPGVVAKETVCEVLIPRKQEPGLLSSILVMILVSLWPCHRNPEVVPVLDVT